VTAVGDLEPGRKKDEGGCLIFRPQLVSVRIEFAENNNGASLLCYEAPRLAAGTQPNFRAGPPWVTGHLRFADP